MRREVDPFPWTWELPIACLAVGLFAGVIALQCGRSLAFAVAGRGWVWPARGQLLGSVPGLLGGHPAAGLGRGDGSVSTGLFVAAVVVTELVLLVGVIGLCWRLHVRIGPGALLGAASMEEARRLLGWSRLKRVRKVVRPDLSVHRLPDCRNDAGS